MVYAEPIGNIHSEQRRQCGKQGKNLISMVAAYRSNARRSMMWRLQTTKIQLRQGVIMSIVDFWLPILVTGAATFVVGALIWMVMPWHKKDFSKPMTRRACALL